MMVSGLLVTLESAERADGVAWAVRSRPGLTMGRLCDRWMPLAAEARDDAEARELHDWLMALPGVAYVDVISVAFADGNENGVTDPVPDPGRRRSEARSRGGRGQREAGAKAGAVVNRGMGEG